MFNVGFITEQKFSECNLPVIVRVKVFKFWNLTAYLAFLPFSLGFFLGIGVISRGTGVI